MTSLNIPLNDSAIDVAFAEYTIARSQRWDEVAQLKRRNFGWGGAYHRRLAKIYSFLIVPGLRVLEIGCGGGDLLASVRPAYGMGIDLSPSMVELARQNYPDYQFEHADAHHFEPGETFDYIILSDLINDVWDVQSVFERMKPLCHARSRIILNFYSHLWSRPLAAAQRMRMASPMLPQNWLTPPDVANLLYLAGFEQLRGWEEVLCPLRLPLVDGLLNRYVVKLWPFRRMALTNFIMARPIACASDEPAPSVSVVVPARNESGNVEQIFARVPQLGTGTELIFVEGNSTDDTWQAIEKHAAMNPHMNCKLLKQTGRGKGDAVRLGYSQASGDILMILDADLTVPPEDLPRFFEALRAGKGDFINGVRLVYPMQKHAMRLMNLAGNKFFSLAFSWLLGQSIKDSLCGTKVMWRDDYLRLAANRAYFGDFDPFGDFDLLFGAAKLNLKIADMPIRYRERTYGTTNIQRWKHGWLLLKMSVFAAGKIKFV